jgi:molybdate transport system substrate-binding protein
MWNTKVPSARNAFRVVVGLSLVMALLSSCGRAPRQAREPLLCYVGGTMRPAMEELIRLYEARTGRQKIQVDYADSGELLVKVQLSGRGDLFVVHDPYLGELMQKGLGDRGWTVASLSPVIVVPKGNPKNIRGLRDLTREGLRVIVPDPQYAATGLIVARMAEKAGLAKALSANIVTRPRGGGEAANGVALGTADAAICWNAVAHLRLDKLDVVPIEKEFAPKEGVDIATTPSGKIELDYIRVNIATLKSSKQPEAARAFAEFVASDEGRAVWERFGFSPVNPSRPHPAAAPVEGELLVHCAAGMRLPVNTMADEFKKDHKVTIALNYDGSNRLLGQIRLTRKGDVYVAGDAEYITIAEKDGLIAARKALCYFVPVILVPKGNPHKIKTLSDLTGPGLKIGQGDEKAAAVGRIMPELLKRNGVDAAAWGRNVVLETPTVNELALAVKLGTIDGAVVWSAVAINYADATDAIPMDPAKSICPPVCAAVLKGAGNPRSAQAFLEFMASDRGREILRAAGYTIDKPQVP